jgi:hypothetical protein
LEHSSQSATEANGNDIERDGPQAVGGDCVQAQHQSRPDEQITGSRHQGAIRKTRDKQVTSSHADTERGQDQRYDTRRHMRYVDQC